MSRNLSSRDPLIPWPLSPKGESGATIGIPGVWPPEGEMEATIGYLLHSPPWGRGCPDLIGTGEGVRRNQCNDYAFQWINESMVQ